MNRTMQAKIKKARVMSMKASKEAALGESMNELKMGTWTPYWVIVRKDGVDMYRNHADFMRSWDRKSAQVKKRKRLCAYLKKGEVVKAA